MGKSELTTSSAAPDLTALSDADFLKGIVWRRGADKGLTQAARRGDSAAFIAAWTALTPALLEGGFNDGVAWSLPVGDWPVRGALLRTAIALATKKSRTPRDLAAISEAAAAWRAELTDGRPTPLELVALLDGFPHLVRKLPADLAFALWRPMLAATLHYAVQDCDPETPADQRLLRRGEIPLLGARLFAELQGAGRLAKAGRQFLADALAEATDDLGTPRGELLASLPRVVAVYTRVARRAEVAGEDAEDEDSADMFRNFVERLAPLCTRTGRTVLSDGFAQLHARDLFEETLRLSQWPDAEAVSRALFPPRKERNGRAGKNYGDHGSPETDIFLAPAYASDEARIACLRNNWGGKSDLLAVSHHGRRLRIEVAPQGWPLLSGICPITIRHDGRTIPAEGTWESVCWQSDEDADYIELQLEHPSGLRIERQLLLPRDRSFCLLADSVRGLTPGRVDYEARWPLTPDTQFELDPGGRCGRLASSAVQARVFPLALPQDPLHSTAGSLQLEGSELVLRQSAQGRGLYAPLLLDWQPHRRQAPAVWRTLTVSEERRAVPGDEAAGFRLKLDKEHWLIYRSLERGGLEGRAVLGHHTRYETVIGDIEPDGDITPLMQVQYEDG